MMILGGLLMKKFVQILGIVLCLCFVVGIVLYICRPYADEVTVAAIEAELCGNVSAQVGEACYELSASVAFAEVFFLEEWEQTQSKPIGEPATRLRLAEEWVIELYDGGKAAAYYGYASPKTKSEAYYCIPADSVEAITAYIEEHGEPREQGFSSSYFRH